VLLLEETHANNEKAKELLGYEAEIDWKESIETQIAEMKTKQITNMRMNK
jgi:nucleoside-diphosphate-sugar epimerase